MLLPTAEWRVPIIFTIKSYYMNVLILLRKKIDCITIQTTHIENV